MWKNACKNHAGSKTYPDVRKGLGKGSLDGFGFPSSPTVPSSLFPKVKAKESPFSPFPEYKHLQTYSYPVLPVAGLLPSLSLSYISSSFKVQFNITSSVDTSHPFTPRISLKEGEYALYVFFEWNLQELLVSVLSFGRISERFPVNSILFPRILTIFNLKGLDSLLRLPGNCSFGELEPFVL